MKRLIILLCIGLCFMGCRKHRSIVGPQELPDLTITIENYTVSKDSLEIFIY